MMTTQELKRAKEDAVAWAPERAPPMVVHLSDYDLPAFLRVAATFGVERYGYGVTPNADHLIRFHDDESFRGTYAHAEFVLLDSRFLAYLLRLTKNLSLTTCPGSDVTARLFAEVITADDSVVLIGGSPEQATVLSSRYGLRRLRHYDPPMGFIRDPGAVEKCLQYIEQESPFRFCLLAVGSPQQETLARALQIRGRARGLALCVGASINFLTGTEQRAPRWMQKSGIEWLYRLMRNPSRMVKRYLVRGPRIFFLLPKLRFAKKTPRLPA